jgi:hypothetical protein
MFPDSKAVESYPIGQFNLVEQIDETLVRSGCDPGGGVGNGCRKAVYANLHVGAPLLYAGFCKSALRRTLHRCWAARFVSE